MKLSRITVTVHSIALLQHTRKAIQKVEAEAALRIYRSWMPAL